LLKKEGIKMAQEDNARVMTQEESERLKWVKELAFQHFTNLTAASVSGLFVGNFIRELYTELDKFEKELTSKKG
jgi:hypothetical protein